MAENTETDVRAMDAAWELAPCWEGDERRLFDAGWKAATERLQHALAEATVILRDVQAKGEIRNHATGQRELIPPVTDAVRFAADSWLAAHEPLPEKS